MTKTAAPTAPSALSPKARKFWTETVKAYDLAPHELQLLEQACRSLDDIATIEDELKDADLIVTGSMGQPTANPMLTEIRQHRQSFRAMVMALKLPDLDESGAPPRSVFNSTSARDAAQKRWGRGAG